MNYSLKKPYYLLFVEYQGRDAAFNERVEKAARRARDGSGYCLWDGSSDISFSFRSKEAAKNAASRIRAVRPYRKGTRVYIRPMLPENA